MSGTYRLVWLSDLHLEFVGNQVRSVLCQEVREVRPDAVVITGDTGVALTVASQLKAFAIAIERPVYFLLGNHDFYGGSFAEVEQQVAVLNTDGNPIVQLGGNKMVPLGPGAVLIGIRGWGDGRAGLGARSTIRLNDQEHIANFRGLDAEATFGLLRRLGDDSAAEFRRIAPEAFARANHVVLATHVPPFPEACRYRGRPSEPAYLPFFCNVALGEAILEVAGRYPEKRLTVLCGHTHARAEYRPLPNVEVRVAGAEYGTPDIAGVLEFEIP